MNCLLQGSQWYVYERYYLVSIFGMCVTSQIITLQHTLKQQSRKDSTKQTREDSTCLPQVLCEIAYCCVVLVKNN